MIRRLAAGTIITTIIIITAGIIATGTIIVIIAIITGNTTAGITPNGITRGDTTPGNAIKRTGGTRHAARSEGRCVAFPCVRCGAGSGGRSWFAATISAGGTTTSLTTTPARGWSR